MRCLNRKFLLLGVLISLCLILNIKGQIADAGGKRHLHIGYLPILSQLPIIVSHENDRMNFSRFHLEIMKYQSFTSLEAALRVGAIDMACIPVPVAFGIAADGYNIRIIGTIHSGGSRLVAKSPGDLKSMHGNLIGVPGLDSNENFKLDQILLETKLRQGLDYKTIGVPFNTAIKDLKTGRLNATYLPEPYGTIAEKQGIAFEVKNQEGRLTGTLGTVLVVRAEVLEKSKAAVQEWLASLIKSGRFIEKDIKESSANQVAIIQAPYFNFPKEIVMASLTQRKGELNFSQFVPSVDEMKEYLKMVSRAKMMTKSVDLEGMTSLGLVDELVKTEKKS